MTRTMLAIFCTVMLISLATEVRANTPIQQHAVVQKRISLIVRQSAPIAFGTFASSGNGGSLTLNASSGTRSLSGAISALSGGDYGQAEFIITGQPGEEIVITPPVSAILGKAGTGGNMLITDFKINPAEIVTLDGQGTAKIKIGGTLKVPGTVPQGAYSGLFDIEVRYLH